MNYEKEYKKLKAGIKNAYLYAQTDSTKAVLENILPELRESEDGRIGFCDHTPKRKDGTFGRTYRHWRIEDKVYKKKEKFIEALADFNPKVINIKDKPYKNTIARMKNDLATTTSSTTGKTPPHKQ